MNLSLTVCGKMIWDGTYTTSKILPVNLQVVFLSKFGWKALLCKYNSLALNLGFALAAASHPDGWAAQQEGSSRGSAGSAGSGAGLAAWKRRAGVWLSWQRRKEGA